MEYQCNICLKYYANKSSLKRHEKVACKQKFKCDICVKIYCSRQWLNNHKCKKTDKQLGINIPDINKILEKIPDDKHVNIIITNNNNKVEMNNNSKNELNNNSKNKVETKIMNNFLNTEPKNYRFDYLIKEELRNEMMKYINMDGYKEEEADKFMYEEDKFKELDEDIKRKYEKEPLKLEGMKEFFSKLQEESNNRNVVIKKSKSGKCYVYDTSWNEKKLKTIITKLCNKVCDTLFDTESSVNHFIREIIESQPGRCRELRKHIQTEIRKAGKLIAEEEKEQIEN